MMRRCRAHHCRQYVLVEEPDAPGRCYSCRKVALGLLDLDVPTERVKRHRPSRDAGWMPRLDLGPSRRHAGAA